MNLLSLVIFCFLIIITINTLLNFFNWNKTKIQKLNNEQLTILIPARNEARNIRRCIESIDISNNLIKEIIVLDDNSEDQTWFILEDISKINPKLNIKKGAKKPNGWSGKSFACHQLSKFPSTEWILFIDADTELKKGAPEKLLSYSINNNVSMLSAWPQIEMKSISEKLLMPLLNFIVFTTFPTIYAKKSNMPSLGLAHGACILFNKKIYEDISGHELVKDSLFEDTELAKKWRSNNQVSACINGLNIINVRMYTNFKDIWLGFEKNSYPAFKNDLFFFIFQIFNFLFFSFPVIFMSLHLLKVYDNYLLFLSGLLILFLRILLSVKFRHPIWSSFFHIVAETVFLLISLSSFIKYNFFGGIKWKSRKYGK